MGCEDRGNFLYAEYCEKCGFQLWEGRCKSRVCNPLTAEQLAQIQIEKDWKEWVRLLSHEDKRKIMSSHRG